MRPLRTATAALLGTALLLLGSCGDDDGGVTKATGPFAIGTRTLELVDEERTTPAFGDAPEQPHRTVTTEVWYPAEGDAAAPPKADAPAADGPFPVIVFGHGQQGEPQQYVEVFTRWARAGYVVVAPRFPLTIKGGSGAPFVADIAGETGDIPFVIGQLDDELGDVADVDTLAVAGHSSGAVDAWAAAFNTCCHDDRIDAVLIEGFPAEVPLDGEYAEELRGLPLLMIHGTADIDYPIDGARAQFAEAAAPKWFMTLEGGDHSEDYRMGPLAIAAADAALHFFDLTLQGDDAAADRLARTPGVESVQE